MAKIKEEQPSRETIISHLNYLQNHFENTFFGTDNLRKMAINYLQDAIDYIMYPVLTEDPGAPKFSRVSYKVKETK